MVTKRNTSPKSANADAIASVSAPKKTDDLPQHIEAPKPKAYDIEVEKVLLQSFMESPERMADESDPMYERYLTLMDHIEALELEKAKFHTRKGADAVVEAKEFFGVRELGSLVGESVDQMTVHTLEAYRMFMGRTREPGTDSQPIIGGKRVASALRNLWSLTVDDNPYADWALLRHEQTIKEVAQRLTNEINAATNTIEQQRKRGLSFSVLQSSAPQSLNLGFKSPYGYAIASMITDFDYFVRLQKTLSRKNLASDEEARHSINLITRFIRRVFNETARFDRWLMRPELRGLTRLDFLPNAAPDSVKRMEFATGVFGVVPAEIYSGVLQPRHSRRRFQVSATERNLLTSVGQGLQQREVTSGPETELI